MKRSRREETTIEIIVGAFMFLVLLTLGVITIVLSRENFFRETYMLEIVFEDVQGLRSGDYVWTRGVEVGKVDSMEIMDDGVHVHAELDRKLALYEDYQIELVPASMLGGQNLSVYVGTDATPLLPEGTVLQGSPPVNLMEEAGETVQRIRSFLEEGGVLDNMKATIANVKDVSDRIARGEGTIGKILADDQVYETLQTTLADVKASVENFKAVSQRIAEGKGTVGKLLSEDDQLYEDLKETVAAIKQMTTSIAEGEGTIGKLATDDAIYDDARLLLQELRAMIDDVRETAPITTFTSIFFGAF